MAFVECFTLKDTQAFDAPVRSFGSFIVPRNPSVNTTCKRRFEISDGDMYVDDGDDYDR